jgi:hypothetical protein
VDIYGFCNLGKVYRWRRLRALYRIPMDLIKWSVKTHRRDVPLDTFQNDMIACKPHDSWRPTSGE